MSPAQSRNRVSFAVVAPMKAAGVLLALIVSFKSLVRLCLPSSLMTGVGWDIVAFRGADDVGQVRCLPRGQHRIQMVHDYMRPYVVPTQIRARTLFP
jgi:hypothetical protein